MLKMVKGIPIFLKVKISAVSNDAKGAKAIDCISGLAHLSKKARPMLGRAFCVASLLGVAVGGFGVASGVGLDVPVAFADKAEFVAIRWGRACGVLHP